MTTILPESLTNVVDWHLRSSRRRAWIPQVAEALKLPVALLSRDREGWQFEGEGFPRSHTPVLQATLAEEAARPWTGILLGEIHGREWLLMLPGPTAEWTARTGLEEIIEFIGRNLASAPEESESEDGPLARRLHALARRLTRSADPARTHALILHTMAAQVGAATGAFALYSEAEGALTITATVGYPRVAVEHLRIAPGAGVLGQAFLSGRAFLGTRRPDAPRRLRYRSDSYLVVPIRVAGGIAAVVTLTDRLDGSAFTKSDLTAVRLLSGPAALGLAREQVRGDIGELTRVATVDAVTGLFNRRYFEERLNAEIQRVRREEHELALLMVDIDDFKHINDTLGHLEGDRALRAVADLLRSGVRIFDMCARYGGDEFAIVMPGASKAVAVQVAERIRRGVSERARPAITVSIGVGLLAGRQSPDELIDAADRTLAAAKQTGKNRVMAD